MHTRNRFARIAVAVCIATSTTLAFAQDPAAAPVKGTQADNTAVNQRDRASDAMTPMDQPNNIHDIKLASAVRKAIVDDKSLSTTAHNVKLIAVSGVVTLRGPVTSDSEKAEVTRVVAAVSGVTHVNDQLDIKTN